MHLSQLSVQHIRAIKQASMLLSEQVNVISGLNGAGKSSLLEAIALLATGQSFRTRQVNEVITSGENLCWVTGQVRNQQQIHQLGIQRDRQGEVKARIDGEAIRQLSALSDHLPLRVLHPESNKLVLGGSTERRRFLDWLLFHVEHRFRRDWQDYQRILLQRNALLKQHRVDYPQFLAWDQSLSGLHERLTLARERALTWIHAYLPRVISELHLPFELELSYYAGADKHSSLAEQLQRHFERCRRQKITSLGAHKADMLLKVDGVEAKKVLSRGQVKAISYCLFLAQIQVLHEKTAKQAVVLMDDIRAELDAERVEELIRQLSTSGQQLIVTVTDREADSALTRAARAMFHVEHGHVSQVI